MLITRSAVRARPGEPLQIGELLTRKAAFDAALSCLGQHVRPAPPGLGLREARQPGNPSPEPIAISTASAAAAASPFLAWASARKMGHSPWPAFAPVAT